MNHRDKVSSLICLGVGLFIILVALLTMKVGSMQEAGPGLFPLLTGCFLALFSALTFLGATNSGEKKTVQSLWPDRKWFRVFVLVLVLLVYAFVLETTGFLITTLLLLVFLFKMESKKWKLIMTYSFSASILAYLLFDRILQLQLPRIFPWF